MFLVSPFSSLSTIFSVDFRVSTCDSFLTTTTEIVSSVFSSLAQESESLLGSKFESKFSSSSLFGDGGGVFVCNLTSLSSSLSSASSLALAEVSAISLISWDETISPFTSIDSDACFTSCSLFFSKLSGSDISMLILQCISFKESFFALSLCSSISSSPSFWLVLPTSSAFSSPLAAEVSASRSWSFTSSSKIEYSLYVCSLTFWIVLMCFIVFSSIVATDSCSDNSSTFSRPDLSTDSICSLAGDEGGVMALSTTITGKSLSSCWSNDGDEGGVLTLSWTKMCELRLLPIFFKSTRRLVSSSFTLSLFLSLSSIMLLVAFWTSWIIFSISFVISTAVSSSTSSSVLLDNLWEHSFSICRLIFICFKLSVHFCVLQTISNFVMRFVIIESSPMTSLSISCLYSKWISLASPSSSLLLWDSSKKINWFFFFFIK